MAQEDVRLEVVRSFFLMTFWVWNSNDRKMISPKSGTNDCGEIIPWCT